MISARLLLLLLVRPRRGCVCDAVAHGEAADGDVGRGEDGGEAEAKTGWADVAASANRALVCRERVGGWWCGLEAKSGSESESGSNSERRLAGPGGGSPGEGGELPKSDIFCWCKFEQ